ncbi:hypothetical protein DFH09DRAFT_1462066 [Mycena vulgaris]|nr:hypothetical protein DFH09DRAFT_1462066 [Mycena vulgaris]
MGAIRAVVLTVFTLAGAVPSRSFSATIPNFASGMPLAPPLARYRGGAPSAALYPCHSPTPLVSALASPTSALADISHQSSAIISLPASSHSMFNASTGTVPFLPQNSAADVSPISAADISASISPSTTSLAGTSNGIRLEIGGTGMSMALALAIRGGFAFL